MGRGKIIQGEAAVWGEESTQAQRKVGQNKKPDIMELTEELKTKMIEALNLEEMTPADIDDNAPLFGDEGLGLDSIDVLELIVLLERNYGIKISDPKQGKEIFASVRTMADYVAVNRTK